MSQKQELGEQTTLSKNTKQFESLRTTVPMFIVKQWKLKVGDKIDWSYEVVNGQLAVVVRKVSTKK
jgi:hypothetical protein